ncbi:MAG: leucyl aminopeptidase [Isosphaeraceae bacterium]
MNVEFVQTPLAEIETEILAVGILDGQTHAPTALGAAPVRSFVESLLARGEISGSPGELTPIHDPEGLKARTLLLFGLGKKATFGPGPAFAAGVALTRKLTSRARASVSVALPEGEPDADRDRAFVEGLVVGTRGADLLKTQPDRHPIERLVLVSAEPGHAESVRKGVIVGESVNLARELANTPPAAKTPTKLAARAREAAIACGLGIEIWDEARLHDERFGGLLGVAAGSAEPPAFVILNYAHGGDAPWLALVGKGVTFDSGGLSLKPSASMEDMKADMTGAAVVLSTMAAIARLQIPVNVRGYLPLTENMTGGHAMKLGDVLTMRNGTTVEILNTDAEGRLILADALSYAAESQPARILDLATLTGACVVALGTKVAGLFSNEAAFAGALVEASARTGERLWQLPLDDDYRDALKSQIADLKNVGGKWGGAITAAKFLQNFVGEIPWVHLDIAGPAWSESEGATRDAGATGCYVRTLVRLIEESVGWSVPA